MKIRLSPKWLILFALCTMAGLISASTSYTEGLLDKEPDPLRYSMVNELTGAYSVFILLPIVLRFMDRFPISKRNWYRHLPIHVLASMIFGIAHTSLMTASRIVLYPLLQLGAYQFGDPVYRFLMEYHKQLLIYLLIFSSHTVLRYYQHSSRLKTQLAQAQLESLKGQLQPHFLFNTLNMISNLMYEDVKKADRMISKLSALLRMSLDDSGVQRISLEKELEFLNLYVDLMKSRFEEKLEVSLAVPPELLHRQVPNFLLQPFVENAIKHNQNSDLIQVHVRASLKGESLLFEVKDNGPGINGTQDPFIKGVGLSNARDRLQQLYGQQFQLRLLNQPGSGLTVQIEIPVEPENHENPRTHRG